MFQKLGDMGSQQWQVRSDRVQPTDVELQVGQQLFRQGILIVGSGGGVASTSIHLLIVVQSCVGEQLVNVLD